MNTPKYNLYFAATLDKNEDGTDTGDGEYYHDITLSERVSPESIDDLLEFFQKIMKVLTYGDATIQEHIIVD